jgi:POT family proton-dependent oligopeptide transporter
LTPVASSASQSKTVLGQPAGLATLFFTEMWERFTYYGMRAILILFLVGSVSSGGLGIDDRTASCIYGLYIAATYVFSLFGGWIADRLVGAQRAVIGGGVLIVCGNALLALGSVRMFFLGLLVIVLGVGLLKPNISAMVASLYPEGGSRRDAGFTIFYMGISVGALLGSLLIPLCAARFGWRFGFALPVVGMLFGLAQFMLTRRWLGTSGLTPSGLTPSGVRAASRKGMRAWLPVILFILAVLIIVELLFTGQVVIDPVAISAAASWVMALFAAAYFVYLLAFAGLSAEERRRVYVMIALFIGYATFYAGFEQGGASLNLFAERYTNRDIFGWHMPAGVLQGTTALVTILFAPAFAALWIALGRRGRDLSPAAKFAAGLALLSAGFLVMFVASRYVLLGQKVLPTWLILTYFLQECGDLCLSPVGLSSMTKLAPPRFVGQVMGVWFLSLALGNNLAGQLSREYDASNLQSLPGLFIQIFWWALAGAAAMLLLTPFLKRMMAGVK